MGVYHIFIAFVFGVAVLFSGCSSKQFKVLDLNDSVVEDLQKLPQSPHSYLSSYKDSLRLKAAQSDTRYYAHYYRVWWKKPTLSRYEAMWPFRAFNEKHHLYGMNLKPLEDEFFQKLRDNANFVAYMQIAKKALTLRGTNIRAFATDEIVMKNPLKAGEGFPFDYMQNSYIAANKPLFVSHFSKDGRWVFVISAFTSGWVKVQDVVFIPDEDADVWQSALQVHVTTDKKIRWSRKYHMPLSLRLGMSLPVRKELEEGGFRVVCAVKKGKNGEIVYDTIDLKADEAVKKSLLMNRKNIDHILSLLKKSRYGWGGLYAERDCSSTIRDYFAPFGIWLGRNSAVMAHAGKVFSLQRKTPQEKIETIKSNAIPFETLLYRNGHIGLYVGMYDNQPIVFQNMWGIKTKNGDRTGRIVVGRAVFSSLQMGRELSYYDEKSSFLSKLRSFNVVTLNDESALDVK